MLWMNRCFFLALSPFVVSPFLLQWFMPFSNNVCTLWFWLYSRGYCVKIHFFLTKPERGHDNLTNMYFWFDNRPFLKQTCSTIDQTSSLFFFHYIFHLAELLNEQAQHLSPASDISQWNAVIMSIITNICTSLIITCQNVHDDIGQLCVYYIKFKNNSDSYTLQNAESTFFIDTL